MKTIQHYDAIVIGGGIYGVAIALKLKKLGFAKIVILEKGPALMERATLYNQARVHNGYHYPRSFMTAYRSHVNSERFIKDFHDCIYDRFDGYYAVAKNFSGVTASQFKAVMDRIGSPIAEAPLRIKKYFNPDYIEEVFEVKEHVFDAKKLAARFTREMNAHAIECRLNCRVVKVEKGNDGIDVLCQLGDANARIAAKYVFNATYSQTNKILRDSGLPSIHLKHELAEIAFVRVPDELKKIGVTVMDGSFFSCMPFPLKGMHTLSHVRYTPHAHWSNADYAHEDNDIFLGKAGRKSNFLKMVRDAEHYIPLMGLCSHQGSLFEIKTVLPQNENDDGRPILFKKNHGIENFTCVIGGKIDNVYDIEDELEDL